MSGIIDDKTVIAQDVELTVYADAQKRQTACLIQYSGNRVGKCFHLDLAAPSHVAGRSPDADLRIDEQSVSRKHVKFSQRNGSISVADLGSANGTFINDNRISSEVKLRDGDFLRLGTVLLKFFASNNVDAIVQDKIYRMATIDAGTQTYNKQYIVDTLESEIKFHHNRRQPLSLIYFDLDHFKKVNDTYGHNAGDTVLRQTAKIVTAAIRKDDTLGRFGGEEFIVILPNTPLATCRDLAERLRRSVAAHTFRLEQDKGGAVNHRQTISLGIFELNSAITTAEELLEKADQKLYTSKTSGRNRVTA